MNNSIKIKKKIEYLLEYLVVIQAFISYISISASAMDYEYETNLNTLLNYYLSSTMIFEFSYNSFIELVIYPYTKMNFDTFSTISNTALVVDDKKVINESLYISHVIKSPSNYYYKVIN